LQDRRTRLPAEFEGALRKPAVIDVQAVLQLEKRFQTAAEIFGALEAPTAALSQSALQLVVWLPRTLLV
jgi:hypothetical protein